MEDYRIIFKSGEHTLEISPDSQCRLVAGGLSGFDCSGFDVSVRPYAYLAGGCAVRRRFIERELSMTFELCARGEEGERLRRKIITMMNPEADCVLETFLYGAGRVIDVIPCGKALFERDGLYDPMEVTLEFTAPSVFFRDAEGERVQFCDRVKLLTFPLSFMAGAGMSTGIMRTSDRALLMNPGDTECGICVSITADGGRIVNPGISLDGGRFVKCPVTLSDGDVLEIDTRARMKNILVNGVRQFTFDRRSDFFGLPVGEGEVRVICDSGIEYVKAWAEYIPLYFGA